jgi:hypothetical protein
MARLNASAAIAFSLCLAGGACDGPGALFPARSIALPALGDAGLTQPAEMEPPPVPGRAPPNVPEPVDVAAPDAAVQPSGSDAGALEPEPDANPPAPLPTPVVVNGPAVELPRLGIEGGDARLGACQGGVIIGVRTTANPSQEVFGQRLTFLEPICGKVLHSRSGPGPEPSGAIRVTRDDAAVAWAVTEGFLGVPSTEVPDPRLIWVLQPATVCPESAPVVVGLSGEYDPIAPDVPDTAAIRSLLVECAPLVVASNGIDVVASESGHQLISHAESFAAGGSATYRSACEGGGVTTQIKVHAGFWLDGFVLGCSTLSVE